MLPTFFFDGLDGAVSVFVGQEGGGGEEPEEGGEGFGVLLVAKSCEVGLEVGAVGAVAWGADEADAFAGYEHAVGDCVAGEGVCECAHGVGPAASGVEVFVPGPAVDEEQGLPSGILCLGGGED